MAGITLPPLKWLLAGAIVAGAWAYHQDVPVRGDATGTATHGAARSERVRPSLPARVALPASRPSARPREKDRMATAAIARHTPRPKVGVTPDAGIVPKPRSKAAERPRPAVALTATTERGVPVRKPQPGDCECPYDLMINGSTCGARSAMSRGRIARAACYR